jgi:hypothetical protein
MQCKQLLRLIKEWHNHVLRDAMAPARMMQFIDNHIRQCDICCAEKGLTQEIELIRERVLPREDAVKISRSAQDVLTPDIFDDREGLPQDEAADDPV